jgi:hypothetical protein
LNRIPHLLVSALLLGGVIPIFLLLATPNPAQKKPNFGSTPGPPVTKTKLEVKQFSKEFEQWVKTITITSADELTFRWSTDEAANGGVWKVSDKPVSFGNTMTATASQQQQPHVINSGSAGKVPAKGKFLTFEIDFALFAPKNPPPTPRTYWIFVTPMRGRAQVGQAGAQAAGLPSVPVKIVYRKPSSETVHFPECFGNTQCSIGYYCTQSNECKVVGYVCDGHVVKGSDGSVYECSPYLCQAGQCLKTCASVGDCNHPFVCDQNYKCVAPPKKPGG